MIHASQREADNSIADTIRRPSLLLTLLEYRALAELFAYAWFYPLMHLAPRGDGHPVLVVPGFLTSGTSTSPLRHIVKRLGYKGHCWKMGRNFGPLRVEIEKVMHRMQELRWRYEQKVTLVGWSLGGFYVRELARMAPEDTRQVITLGSPLRHIDYTSASRVYLRLNGHFVDHIDEEILDRVEEPPPVPTTSIYSRSDGVVPWQCSLEKDAPQTQNVRVFGSHCGLGHNPSALWVILDRLAQPEAEWKPFDAGACSHLLYPTVDLHD